MKRTNLTKSASMQSVASFRETDCYRVLPCLLVRSVRFVVIRRRAWCFVLFVVLHGCQFVVHEFRDPIECFARFGESADLEDVHHAGPDL